MDYRNTSPWGNCPYYLNFEEIQNPLKVLADFFGDRPETHQKELRLWRDAVCSEKSFKDKHFGGGALVFTFRQNVRLIESCYLLLIIYANQGLKDKINKSGSNFTKNMNKQTLC